MDTTSLLRQILMIGIGTTSLVAERLRQVTDEWVQNGQFNSEQASQLVDDVMAQFSNESGALEEQMQRQLRNVLQDLGVPRQNEMDELRGRIDRLERQVRELENKQWR
ncbi:MAG: phasin family protein [Cyanobacteria bacterium]|nr:phasin family protein [Cyanobacteriota bacterium]MDA0865052.1 phasin family protein [Cyanobacteriota bacterium]